MKKIIQSIVFLLTIGMASGASAASSQASFSNLPSEIGSTIIFSLLGIIVAFISLVFIDLITVGSLRRQLTEEKNVALAIVVGSIIIGVCLLVAASII